jgi:hypothetical protein
MASIGHLKSKRLTRTHVQVPRESIQPFLAIYRQVFALGQVVTNQAVDIFVAPRGQGL